MMRSELISIASKMEVDVQGHLLPDFQMARILLFYDCDLADLKRLSDVLKAGKKVEPFRVDSKNDLDECANCGQRSHLMCDGERLYFSEPCSRPDGMTIEFELNVPSGKIVAADDLRAWFKIYGSFYVNYPIECERTSKAYENIGCAHAMVGNTCPDVFKITDEKFCIASIRSEDDLPGTVVASITTDLWWYSLVDYDEFMRRSSTTPEEHGLDVFDVQPGVYRFRHFTHDRKAIPDRDADRVIFAEFERVRDPDPIRNFIGETNAMNFTAGQIIAKLMKNYPTLYSSDDAGAQRVADHIFCTIGGGGHWHPNGFVMYKPNMQPHDPEVDIPQFDGLYKWYPLSRDYAALVKAAGIAERCPYGDDEKFPDRLNDSFVKLAFNVARCITKWGALPTSPDYVKSCIETWHIAQDALAGLAKKYKDQVPENCKILATTRLEQANWVLAAMKKMCWFEWRDDDLWIVNTLDAKKVNLVQSILSHVDRGDILNSLDFNEGSFGYGVQSRQSAAWSSLIAEMSLWLMSRPHRALQSPLSHGASFKIWDVIKRDISELHDGSLFDRLEQTSYHALSTDWVPVTVKNDQTGEKEELFQLSWYPLQRTF